MPLLTHKYNFYEHEHSTTDLQKCNTDPTV